MMRNKWLLAGVFAAMISTTSLTSAFAAEEIEMARMLSPSAEKIATERSDLPEQAAPLAEPTTIGEATLRHLMATIAPERLTTGGKTAKSEALVAKTDVKAKKAKATKKKRKKTPHKPAKKQPTAEQLAFGKPCHQHPAPGLAPAFLLHEAPVATPASRYPAWQVHRLRHGPDAR